MIDPKQVIDYAREAIGTPYAHQGRLIGMGFDCIGLPIYIAQKLGLAYVDLPAYGATPFRGLLEKMIDQQPCLDRIYANEPGAVLVMEFIIGHPQHMGISTGESIIHCASNTGRVVEHRIDEDTQRQITAMYRFKEN